MFWRTYYKNSHDSIPSVFSRTVLRVSTVFEGKSSETDGSWNETLESRCVPSNTNLVLKKTVVCINKYYVMFFFQFND